MNNYCERCEGEGNEFCLQECVLGCGGSFQHDNEDSGHITEAGYQCYACEEKEAARWLAYFGGKNAIRQHAAQQQFYREEGLLREDGKCDEAKVRALK